ncbi:hypothetical protein Sjap_010220 [Stephania japonica]|uniref:Uncharacterized protein n=1 Tax=Stephania japonica TaxID=461633 RepID=A0AAP0J967_9MAGN
MQILVLAGARGSSAISSDLPTPRPAVRSQRDTWQRLPELRQGEVADHGAAREI